MSDSLSFKHVGLYKAMNGINDELVKIPGACLKGLIKGAFIVKKQAVKRAPIDTGNLRASGYVAWKGRKNYPMPVFRNVGTSGRIVSPQQIILLYSVYQKMIAEAASLDDVTVSIGFAAFYALIVHETLPKSGSYRHGNWKYLETALRDNAQRIITIIKYETALVQAAANLRKYQRAVIQGAVTSGRDVVTGRNLKEEINEELRKAGRTTIPDDVEIIVEGT